ncbi:MAG: arginine deiminase-related protein, partial [Pseudomonadota bacterium]
MEPQTADTVLMVRPAAFGANPETASSNAFQAQRAALDGDASNALAEAQFDGVVTALSAAGVTVIVVDDTRVPVTPDAVFPNNWITTHADGRVILYPMEARNRRTERRSDVVDALQSVHGFTVSAVVDFSAPELEGRFLEGTGSLVLDRVHRRAYACY